MTSLMFLAYPFQFVDSRETIVVCKAGLVDQYKADRKNGPFRVLPFEIYILFESPGFIAQFADALASLAIPVLVVSTFSFNYAFVKSIDINQALAALKKIVFVVTIEEL